MNYIINFLFGDDINRSVTKADRDAYYQIKGCPDTHVEIVEHLANEIFRRTFTRGCLIHLFKGQIVDRIITILTSKKKEQPEISWKALFGSYSKKLQKDAHKVVQSPFEKRLQDQWAATKARPGAVVLSNSLVCAPDTILALPAVKSPSPAASTVSPTSPQRLPRRLRHAGFRPTLPTIFSPAAAGVQPESPSTASSLDSFHTARSSLEK